MRDLFAPLECVFEEQYTAGYPFFNLVVSPSFYQTLAEHTKHEWEKQHPLGGFIPAGPQQLLFRGHNVVASPAIHGNNVLAEITHD